MLNRRTLLGAAGASPLIWTSTLEAAFAETPKDVIVMALQIDDMISCDPQESFEFSGNEVTGNIYEKLIRPDLKDPTKILPQLAEKWEHVGGRAEHDVPSGRRPQVRLRQPGDRGRRRLHADARRDCSTRRRPSSSASSASPRTTSPSASPRRTRRPW